MTETLIVGGTTIARHLASVATHASMWMPDPVIALHDRMELEALVGKMPDWQHAIFEEPSRPLTAAELTSIVPRRSPTPGNRHERRTADAKARKRI